MSQPSSESALSDRLARVEAQLTQFQALEARITRLETQLNGPVSSAASQSGEDWGDRLTKIEEQLMLVSDISRYGELQNHLRAGDFKAADQETTQIFYKLSNKTRDTFNTEDMNRFPCDVLSVLDTLWRFYSQDRFGYSVQLRLYQADGGDLNALRALDTTALVKFVTRVGWRRQEKLAFDDYDQWDFSLQAPEGCFPADGWRTPYGLKMVTFFFTRLMVCNI